MIKKVGETLEIVEKIFDAEGVPIEIGDTVYCDDDSEPFKVISFDGPEHVCLTLVKDPNSILLYTMKSSHLSHKRPILDADGVPIRIGDVLYSSGNECRVVSITVKADEACLGVHTDEGTFLPSVNPKYLSRKKPEPADSWEKLEEDMMRGTSCRYFRGVESVSDCWDCPHGTEQTGTTCWRNERIDIMKRAKKLAGIEEEARND